MIYDTIRGDLELETEENELSGDNLTLEQTQEPTTL